MNEGNAEGRETTPDGPATAPAARGAVAALSSFAGRLGRLTRKELSESLRDTRTIVTLVLMPLLLYPLLGIVFRTLLLSSAAEREEVYRIGFEAGANQDDLVRMLRGGHDAIAWRNTPPEIYRQGGTLLRPPQFIPVPEFQPQIVENVEEAVRAGSVDVGVRLSSDRPFNETFQRGRDVDFDLYFRDDQPHSRAAVLYLERLAAEANARFLAEQLRARGIRPGWYPLFTRAHALPAVGPARAGLLPVLVPLILILMTITGAVYPAIDLTAGERERGTLEMLVAAPIPRLSVLFAKYVAVLTVAMLTALVNLGAMTLTLYASGIGRAVFESALTPLALVEVLALLLLFAAFFSALLLCITSFARSFKEAQAYLIPLMLLALTPGVVGLMPKLSLDGPLAVVPLLNVVLLSRDLLSGHAQLATACVVVAITLLYAVSALALAARIFGTEAVLSSEQGGWVDLFRRPERPRSAPDPLAGLLCLAMLFPAYFLVTGWLGQLASLSVPERLVAMTAANVVLFVGIPAIFAWVGRVRPAPGFRLALPPWASWPVALLLGVSLWPFVHELIRLLREAGLATLGPELVKRLGAELAVWREYPPGMIVLALAVVPAVVEELFFRGYLFRALEAGLRRPLPVIAASAGLFALFHLLVGESLAVERVPASLLMGLVLGWLAWRAGSVWPGMLLHATHNGLLVLLAYYEPGLVAQGWMPREEGPLPPGLLAGAAVVALLGLAGVALLRRRAGEPVATEVEA